MKKMKTNIVDIEIIIFPFIHGLLHVISFIGFFLFMFFVFSQFWNIYTTSEALRIAIAGLMSIVLIWMIGMILLGFENINVKNNKKRKEEKK